MIIESSNFSSTTIVVTDTSIKNDITISISHMYIYNNPITKIVHHVVYVTSTEAELFTIRCGINQASNHNGISKIIVITNSIHAATLFMQPRKSSTPLYIFSKFIQ